MTAFNPAKEATPRRYTNTVRLRTTKRPAAMGDMNVTPFIDVLLVLLIMIIMAVPIKNHVTKVDLPIAECRECTMGDINTVAIRTDDQLLWNGTPVSADQLRVQIERASALSPEPSLRFEPDALASYDRSARTIALIKEGGATKFAFVGNARFKDFSR
ncbi:MAG: biopolymer transporter ExbD [Pseudomonadota bacterium]